MRRLVLHAVVTPLLASAAAPCIDTCQTLVDEGKVLSWQGEPGKALAKFQAAMTATPEATAPLLDTAALLLDLSWHAAEPQAGKWHAGAESLARQALRLEPGNAMAQDIPREALEGPATALHTPIAAAVAALKQAEVLFVQRRFDEARKQYEVVAALDPLWSTPWIGAGDCYFGQQAWPQAEALYRRATEIEPRNAQAWRYLADSLQKQGKQSAAEQALFQAVAASPADRNTWAHLASLRKQAGMPLASLRLNRGSSVTAGADGKYTVHVDEQRVKHNATPDAAFVLSLALVEANLRTKDTAHARSPFDIELEAWRTALRIAGETTAQSGQSLSDPALLQMQAFARDSQLKPALLILAYRPPYRAAFDTWLAAHPDGVKAFIDRYALQP